MRRKGEDGLRLVKEERNEGVRKGKEIQKKLRQNLFGCFVCGLIHMTAQEEMVLSLGTPPLPRENHLESALRVLDCLRL